MMQIEMERLGLQKNERDDIQRQSFEQKRRGGAGGGEML